MVGFLSWLADKTPGFWWNDSAESRHLAAAIQAGASGVTLNPVLVAAALSGSPQTYAPMVEQIPQCLDRQARTQEIIKRVTCHVASMFEPIHRQSGGAQGYVCAQVDPRLASNRDAMLSSARRTAAWAPNVAVKLPATQAGLDVLEEAAAEGIPVVGTVSFTLPQALAIARRYEAGRRRAIRPAPCFAVVMVGRIDDYLRDVAQDNGVPVRESDIIQCGTYIVKRAAAIFRREGYHAALMPAGMRGAYHAQDLAGAAMTFSIHPKIQKLLQDAPLEERFSQEADPAVVARLRDIADFDRAYEPEGMAEADFVRYGAVQRTLAQFIEAYNRIDSM